MNITTVGIDLAKDIVTVHAQNAQGHCVVARNLRFNELAEWLIQLPAGCVVGIGSLQYSPLLGTTHASHGIAAPVDGSGVCAGFSQKP